MEEVKKDVVVICDNKELRRAELINFLKDWAEDKNIALVGTNISNVFNLELYSKCVLCILNVGGDFDPSRLDIKMKILFAIPENPPVAVISDSEKMDLGHLVLQHGGSAFITTTTQPSVVLSALSFVLEGGRYFPPEMIYCSPGPSLNVIKQDDKKSNDHSVGRGAKKQNVQELSDSDTSVNNESSSSGANVAQNLTFRQLDVLTYLSRGQSNKEIARSIGVSESTVKVHVRQVMRKLCVTNRTQAALAATYQGDLSHHSDVDCIVRSQPEYDDHNKRDAQEKRSAISVLNRAVIRSQSSDAVKTA